MSEKEAIHEWREDGVVPSRGYKIVAQDGTLVDPEPGSWIDSTFKGRCLPLPGDLIEVVIIGSSIDQ